MNTGTYMRAGLMSVLLTLFAATVVASPDFSPADAEGRYNYLVTFDEPGLLAQHRQQRGAGQRFDIQAAEIQSARDALMALQASHLADMSNLIRRDLSPSHYYLVTHSGVATRLTETEARQLAALPQVASIERERVYELSTYRGPEFIGAGSIWDGSAVPGGSSLLGEGMIAAVLDTGIPDGAHASFDNDPACGHGTGGVPDKVLSSLDCAATDGSGLCNGPSPGDGNGHGSHTASTVAGNSIDETASPSPTIPGSFTDMSGVAPCAHVRSYKVCSTSSCAGADIQAGLNSVLIHGDPDSVNYSISGGTNPWTDFDRIKLDIVDAGIFVAASAGNTSLSITDPVGQVNHRGPWVMSVAASTRDTNDSGGAAQGDVLAGFSFRGPTPSPLQDLQKPNITGPGVNIYAAVPGGYDFISGTSMSGPHIAGAGLLVAQANPDWTATEIKSAIEMTAFKDGFKENGSTSWDWDDVGSGRVDLTKAALAGLVMDETFQNFLDADPAASGDVKTLNLASVRNLDCTPSCTFTRTVRNTLSDPTNWTAAGSAFEGDFLVDVSPSAFTFTGDTNETQELTITLTPTADTTGSIAFGEIVLSEAGALSPDLHLTAAMSGVGGPEISVNPESMAFVVNEGDSDSDPMTISNSGTLDLAWTITESTPDSVPHGVRGAVAIDEVLDIPDFTVNPTTPVDFDVPAGIANTGNVVGFTYDGTVTAIGSGDWASDMRMIVTAPDSSTFDVGGFDGVLNDWEFQGGGSTNPGTYSSTHMGAFGGVLDAGDWNFFFEHDWSGGTDMSWTDVTVTLHKEAIVCENVTDISWLSVDDTAGTTTPGNDSIVQVQVDSSGLAPGLYEAQVCVNSNASNVSIIAVPVSMEVIGGGGPDTAVLNGTVQSLGYCGGAPMPMSNVEVTVTGQGGAVSTFTNASGNYQVNISETESPVDLSVSPANHLGQNVNGVTFSSGDTVTTDFDLVLTEPCAVVDDQPMGVVMGPDNTASLDLNFDNSAGGASYDWTIETEGVIAGANSRGHFPSQPYSGELVTFDPESSMHADPEMAQAPADRSSPIVIDGTGLIGYSTTGFTADGYVSLDPTVPGTLNLISATQPNDYYAGTFIDNDFTQHYILSTAGGDAAGDDFGTIDVATGVYTSIGTVTGATVGTWSSMAWDHTSDTLYAVNVPAAGTNNLYTIDTGTLEATLVGTIPADIVIAIAINGAGEMFGIDLTPDALIAIDKTDATAATIGPLGFAANFAQDMDFDYTTGTLYWAAYLGQGDSRMTTVDTATGAATVVGNIADGNELLSFTLATSAEPPVCATPGAVPWLNVSPPSGTVGEGAVETVSVNFDSTGLAEGLYEAHLCVSTTDPGHDDVAIPVSLLVGADDVFSDRFEQP